MEYIGCVRCKKSGHDSVAWTFALIAPVHTVLHWVSCSYENITNAPKHYETYENKSLGSNWVDWVCSLRKTPTWLRATNFALIAPVYPVLHRISCSYKTIINAPKHYATHENMSLGSNGVDWVRSLRKISTWLRGTSLCINCTSSHYFASSFMQLRNDPKCIQTLCNAPKHEFRVQWGGLGAFVEKISTWLLGKNFRINCTSSPCFASSFM